MAKAFWGCFPVIEADCFHRMVNKTAHQTTRTCAGASSQRKLLSAKCLAGFYFSYNDKVGYVYRFINIYSE